MNAKNDFKLTENWGDTFRIELRNSDEFKELKTVAINKALGVQAVIGFVTAFNGKIQAYIFDKEYWTEQTAKQWISANSNTPLGDVLLIGKMQDMKLKADRVLADKALIKKLEEQAAKKNMVDHVDSIGVKGDSLECDAWTETAEGITFKDVVFTKEMVQTYSNGKHYKPAEELLKALDSLRGKPVTAYAHPEEKIVTNMEQQVGYIVFDSVKWDKKQKRPFGDVFIKKESKTKQLIEDIKQRKLEEVSVGFRCNEVHKPGEFNGEHYDIRQENFFFDHLALVMQGRASAKDGVGLNAY